MPFKMLEHLIDKIPVRSMVAIMTCLRMQVRNTLLFKDASVKSDLEPIGSFILCEINMH